MQILLSYSFFVNSFHEQIQESSKSENDMFALVLNIFKQNQIFHNDYLKRCEILLSTKIVKDQLVEQAMESLVKLNFNSNAGGCFSEVLPPYASFAETYSDCSKGCKSTIHKSSHIMVSSSFLLSPDFKDILLKNIRKVGSIHKCLSSACNGVVTLLSIDEGNIYYSYII